MNYEFNQIRTAEFEIHNLSFNTLLKTLCWVGQSFVASIAAAIRWWNRIIWSYGSIGAQNVGIKFHHLMVEATAAPNVVSNKHKLFNRVQSLNWFLILIAINKI